jgi:hypothetical protein
LDIQPFSLDGLMRYLAVILSTSIGDKEIEAVLDLDTHLPLDLLGDSLRLQQVLINLSGNSVKFTETAEIVVSLKMIALNKSTMENRIRGTRHRHWHRAGTYQGHLGGLFSGGTVHCATLRRLGSGFGYQPKAGENDGRRA